MTTVEVAQKFFQEFPAYPEYKDSGIEWLGEIPITWNTHRLKHLAKVRLSNVDKHSKPDEKPVYLCNYTDVYYQDFITANIGFMVATATDDQIINFALNQGDVLITKDSESPNDIAVPAYVKENLDNVICGYHLAHIRPNKIQGAYLFHTLKSENISTQFRMFANGITRFGIGKSTIDNALFPVPPLSEQKSIAHFLDQATAEIDHIIDQQQQLIALLQEERTTVISHAVTKGLDPSVPMQDSGIEWLGEIPQHWEFKRLKHISPGISVGLVINPSTYVSEDGTVPFLFGSNVNEESFQLDDVRLITEESNIQLSASMLLEGDLVIVRVGYPGITAVIPKELERANCASMVIIRKSPSFVSDFLCKCMNSSIGKHQVELVAYGAAQKQFNVSHAVDFIFPFPPIEEQREISNYLRTETARIDEAIANVKEQIAKLEEYRTALISDAVTGKIDVRGWRE